MFVNKYVANILINISYVCLVTIVSITVNNNFLGGNWNSKELATLEKLGIQRSHIGSYYY